MVGGRGRAPAGLRAEADPGAIVARDDTLDGGKTVLTMRSELLLKC